MGLPCAVCEHEHEDDGSCFCGCTAEEDAERFCPSCGCLEHEGRECKCGCPG
jgi:hypothetical protein